MASTVKGSLVVGRVGEAGAGLMGTIIRKGCDKNAGWSRHGPPVRWTGWPRPVLFIDKGLIGFDVGTGSDIVRPELLRLVNRGNHTSATDNSARAWALAA